MEAYEKNDSTSHLIYYHSNHFPNGFRVLICISKSSLIQHDVKFFFFQMVVPFRVKKTTKQVMLWGVAILL